jgi:hypothetical protein
VPEGLEDRVVLGSNMLGDSNGPFWSVPGAGLPKSGVVNVFGVGRAETRELRSKLDLAEAVCAPASACLSPPPRTILKLVESDDLACALSDSCLAEMLLKAFPISVSDSSSYRFSSIKACRGSCSGGIAPECILESARPEVDVRGGSRAGVCCSLVWPNRLFSTLDVDLELLPKSPVEGCLAVPFSI